MNGRRIVLPKGTKIEDGTRIVPKAPKAPPAKYRRKTKRRWKAVSK